MTHGTHFFPPCLQKQTQSSLGVTHLTTGGLRTLASLFGQEQVRTQSRRQTHMRHPPNPLHPLAPLARIRRTLPRTPQIHRIPHTRYSRPMRSEAACTLRAPPRRPTPAPRLKAQSAPCLQPITPPHRPRQAQHCVREVLLVREACFIDRLRRIDGGSRSALPPVVREARVKCCLCERRASATACVREARVRARDRYTDAKALRYREKAIEQKKNLGKKMVGRSLRPRSCRRRTCVACTYSRERAMLGGLFSVKETIRT